MRNNTAKLLIIMAALCCLPTGTARADEITDWNATMLQVSASATPPTSPPVMVRVAAIVQSAVFDAVNGIERRYTHIRVAPNAPRGASKRAAAVQAAYVILSKVYASQQATLDAKRITSLAGISSGAAAENSESIARGIAWGQSVADAIWAWRQTDGFNTATSSYVGTLPGQWRPTPPGNGPGVVPQLGTTTPFVIASPSQFRPAGPPALTSAQYTTDYNEVKTMGSATSAARTADQTTYSLFWNASTATYYWDTITTQLAAAHHLSFSETNRLLALVNLVMADAGIGCWEAKYHYVFWRPITAIRLGDTDGNANTAVDLTWNALFGTPAHPDYPSGHSCVSGAAGAVLQNYFGDNTPFSIGSNVMVGTTRFFPSLSSALVEIKNARIFAGIHFRAACDDGQALGIGVANYTLGHALLPLNGNKTGQIQK